MKKKECPKLKMNDILEVKKIKQLLKKDKSIYDVESMFLWMETICDKEINKIGKYHLPLPFFSEIEEAEEEKEETEEESKMPELSDHSSDTDDDELPELIDESE
jgi:hypothetical protein